MANTVPISAFAKKYRDKLTGNARIDAYCMDKYGKTPTLFVGVNGKKMPDVKFCPLIVILASEKLEGMQVEENEYDVVISWIINQPDIVVDGVQQKWSEQVVGNVIEFVGTYEVDELGQIIYEELAEVVPSYPATRSHVNIDTQEFFPQWPGRMTLTTEIPVCIGGDIILD